VKRFSISVQVETAIAVALAIVLSYIKFFQMPQGGSVSLQMVPIVLLAVRRGPKVGLLGGLLFGVLKSMLNPSFYVDPVQHILDYPVAFTVIGLVGLWVKYGKTRKDLIGNAAAVCFVFGLRFLVHVLSGKIFFGIYAPEGMNQWWYSLTYNAAYLLPEMIVTLVVVMFLLTRRDLVEVDQDGR
jgi:thiamine transporter